MPRANKPSNEAQRLAELASLQIIGTLREESYDSIVKVASNICEVPIAFVSFMESDQQWLKAYVGLESDKSDRETSFCAHAIEVGSPVVVPDALKDDRFRDNPRVTNAPRVRFYAGFPLKLGEGLSVGTLCVVDTKPRELTPKQQESMELLSLQVVQLLELHRERRRAEVAKKELEALLRETALYQRLFEKSPGLLCIAGYDGYFKILSPQWMELLGYSEVELKSKPFVEFVHPDDVEATNAEAEHLADPLYKAIAFENRYRKADGSYVWLSWRAVGDDERDLLLAIAEDVSAHKEQLARVATQKAALQKRAMQQKNALSQAQAQLHGKEVELFQFLTALPVGILVKRLDGSAYFANPHAYEMLGADPNSTPHGALAEMATPYAVGAKEPLPEEARPIARALCGEAVLAAEVEFLRDGTRVPALVSAVPVLGPDGTVTYGIAAFQDLSEVRRLESQLLHAQKMEAVGRLAGGVAHDFNNLLTAIFSFTGFAMEGMRPEDPAFQDLQEVQKAGERAKNLTQQLLAFSRKQVAAPRALALNDHVAGMDRMLRRILGEDIEFSTTFEDRLWATKVDPGHLEQVLVNLAVNARDAMPQGGKLTIETANAALDEAYALQHGAEIPAGDYVMFAVSDCGEGMDRTTQSKIFDPFFTTKPEGKGTGLGLSTCYGIVKQAGGYIWVYSELGKGTSFKVYLPRFNGRSVRVTENKGLADIRGTETILVAEDDDQVRALIKRTLSRCGYTLLEAANGGEAFMLAEQYDKPIHLLVTDVVMPRMSGKQLVERISRIHEETRVIFISGYTENAIVHHGVLDEGIDLLQKPFTPDALANRVREALNREPVGLRPAKRSILCVDDDAKTLRALQRNLNAEYDVVIANSGEAALGLIESRDFDLVLCDIVMPGMDGPELHVLASQRCPEVAERFVFVTGVIDSDFVDSFLSTTVRPVMSKPIDMSEVRKWARVDLGHPDG